MMPQQQGQPQQAPNPIQVLQQHGQQVQQQVSQQLQTLDQTITIEKVVKFLRDERVRSFSIEIETDSTIMPDEAAEKSSRNEFLGAFSQASAGVQGLLQLGQSGAELAGGLLKFALAPYRVGRQLDGLIEQFCEQAPQIVQQQMQAQQPQGQDPALAQVQQQLAQAELQKAQAQMQRVQAESELKFQQNQLAIAKAQSDAEHRQNTQAMEAQRLQAELQQAQADLQETLANIERVRVETQMLIANAQTARQTADNDSARVIAEVGGQQFEQDQAMMQPVGIANE
ncbi:hypothetical protein [Gluconobacter kondonii]|uniref:hypothetical protein n=1 Tax=Gluconobacter kondonii TaxID=941463 RepID=UPI001B8D67A4|nr:hypothetical protein [Gluconobacter kondonii]MBS1065922.1 hypothetical protein [Gluconobacter kondonii]MBS1082342.1 hypothetical protein [Gluconobacter kondonii]